MTTYFKLTNHYERHNFPYELLAYSHAPLTRLDLPAAAWAPRGTTAVPAPSLLVGDEIVLFQYACGVSQIVTHVVRVTGPAAHNVRPGTPFPHVVPVKTVKMLDPAIFGVTFRPLGDPPSIAGHATAAHRPANIGAPGNGVRFGHLIGIGNTTDRGIQSGVVRHTASNGRTLQQNLMAQYLTAQYGYL